MAKRATKESVEQRIGGPDYASALSLIEGKLVDAKAAQGQASKKQAEVWTAIEKLGLNKLGAQLFNRVFSIEDDKDLDDCLRTFSKLCSEAGLSITRDIVDQAEGVQVEVVPTRAPDGVMSPEVYQEETARMKADEPGEAPAPTDDLEPKKGRAKAAGSSAGAGKPKLSIVTPDAMD